MKHLLTLLFVLSVTLLYCQKRAVTMYNNAWFLTTKDYAEYYRVGILDTVNYKFHGPVVDFYMDGKTQMKGQVVANVNVDTFYFYFPNGSLQSKGRYLEGKRYGIWQNYYQSGQVKETVVFR